MTTEAAQLVADAIIFTSHQALSRLVMACLSADGSIKAPSKAELMHARSMLPSKFAGTLVKQRDIATEASI